MLKLIQVLFFQSFFGRRWIIDWRFLALSHTLGWTQSHRRSPVGWFWSFKGSDCLFDVVSVGCSVISRVLNPADLQENTFYTSGRLSPFPNREWWAAWRVKRERSKVKGRIWECLHFESFSSLSKVCGCVYGVTYFRVGLGQCLKKWIFQHFLGIWDYLMHVMLYLLKMGFFEMVIVDK